MPTAERVRALREQLFAAGSVAARADGRSRELFPVAVGLEEGLALPEGGERDRWWGPQPGEYLAFGALLLASYSVIAAAAGVLARDWLRGRGKSTE